jgi:hypothetical protein
MERSIRLNAVETSSQGGNFGMKLYNLHLQNHLTPEKVSINCSAVSIAAATVIINTHKLSPQKMGRGSTELGRTGASSRQRYPVSEKSVQLTPKRTGRVALL